MAFKTLLRQLISKWGIMSIELQSAFTSDMSIINEDGTNTYPETDIAGTFTPQEDAIEVPQEQIQEEEPFYAYACIFQGRIASDPTYKRNEKGKSF